VALSPFEYAVWRVLDLEFPSVFKNLALEEALAMATEFEVARPTVRFWKNPPSVILGRFQDPQIEVDIEFCSAQDIAIGRRFTGGGAVFHDAGNLNLTILTPPLAWTLGEVHRTFSQILIEYLKEIGLHGEYAPPNSVLIGGKKVAGAAAARTHACTLWHACILVSTDLHILERALRPSVEKTNTNFVRSSRLPVTTIKEEIGLRVGIDDVIEGLKAKLTQLLGGSSTTGNLGGHEQKLLSVLHDGKYSSEDWNMEGREEKPTPKRQTSGLLQAHV